MISKIKTKISKGSKNRLLKWLNIHLRVCLMNIHLRVCYIHLRLWGVNQLDGWLNIHVIMVDRLIRMSYNWSSHGSTVSDHGLSRLVHFNYRSGLNGLNWHHVHHLGILLVNFRFSLAGSHLNLDIFINLLFKIF